jgi:uncharacterized protein (DUF2336 family)
MNMSPAKERLVHLLGLSGQKITYEQARDLLDHPDTEVRLELAARSDLEPEILFYLANDPDREVRRTIATNHATPAKASLLLAADADADVRCDLADRIGNLVPGLTPDQQKKAWKSVNQALMLLARDQLPRVRRVLSQALHTLPDAPHDVIVTLANDPETSVACPVLQFSPVLTDDDLLAVIQATPLTASLVAISSRINVGEEVSHALVGTGQVDVITALLRNESAQIREETLDAIIDAAPRQVSWHEPLVHRRNLQSAAALRIAEFVASSLLQKLAERQDFDPATVANLNHVVREKLRREEGLGATAGAFDAAVMRLAEDQVSSLARAGKLAEKHLLQVAAENTAPLLAAALARLADLPVDTVVEVIRATSAKGMLAVCWAADLSAEAAAQLQLKIARVPPGEVIAPRAGGGFDATETELEWQLEMFKDLARQRAVG